MTEDTRAGRRQVRRAPETRCRTGVPAAPPVPGPWPQGAVAEVEIEVSAVRGGTAVATVTGELDVHTADTLRARLTGLHESGFRRIVVDFAGVPFCDAAGLGALVSAHNNAAAAGAEIVLAGVRPAQLRLLRITGLHRLFVVHPDVADAVAGATSA